MRSTWPSGFSLVWGGRLNVHPIPTKRSWGSDRSRGARDGAGLGGTAITGAANRIPELVDRLVYISAWACVQRANPIEYMQEPEFADNLMAPLAAFNVGDPFDVHTMDASHAGYLFGAAEVAAILDWLPL